jgi:hypothetical protein
LSETKDGWREQRLLGRAYSRLYLPRRQVIYEPWLPKEDIAFGYTSEQRTWISSKILEKRETRKPKNTTTSEKQTTRKKNAWASATQ